MSEETSMDSWARLVLGRRCHGTERLPLPLIALEL